MPVLTKLDLTHEMKKQKLGTLTVNLTLGRSFPIRMKLCVLLCRLAAWVCPMQLDVVEE